ncbi:MAG: carbonyl reductase [Vampirovibrio sp.]|jgi:NAD(P)-dependent dehydrogenase (short-subunit alcohol dehydrogenase family)|nr:carbonyl reductase [Vampirovibrio sp.]
MADRQPKIALVTGSSKGLGLELVRQLARSGVITFLTARNEAQGKAAQATLQQEGLAVEFLHMDVTNLMSIHAAANHIEQKHDKLDILVNNAGILPDEDSESNGLLIAPDIVRQVFETNTMGPLQTSQVMIHLLRRSPHGKIVNISSGMGSLAEMDGGYPAYRISKTALNAVTKILAYDLQDSAITVNSICPGWVRTDMGGPNAERSTEQSVAGILPLLLSNEPGPNGQFLRDGMPIPW